MLLLDVNVLVYSFRTDSPDHQLYRQWLCNQISEEASPLGISELALSGFLRIATHPKVFQPPTPISDALKFTDSLLAGANIVRMRPSKRHWAIFSRLCEQTGTTGNAIPDAFHAALAIENSCEWITTDKGFAKFPGLRWRHPLM